MDPRRASGVKKLTAEQYLDISYSEYDRKMKLHALARPMGSLADGVLRSDREDSFACKR